MGTNCGLLLRRVAVTEVTACAEVPATSIPIAAAVTIIPILRYIALSSSITNAEARETVVKPAAAPAPRGALRRKPEVTRPFAGRSWHRPDTSVKVWQRFASAARLRLRPGRTRNHSPDRRHLPYAFAVSDLGDFSCPSPS